MTDIVKVVNERLELREQGSATLWEQRQHWLRKYPRLKYVVLALDVGVATGVPFLGLPNAVTVPLGLGMIALNHLLTPVAGGRVIALSGTAAGTSNAHGVITAKVTLSGFAPGSPSASGGVTVVRRDTDAAEGDGE